MKLKTQSLLWCCALAWMASPVAAQSRFSADVYTTPRADSNPFLEQHIGDEDCVTHEPILRLRDPSESRISVQVANDDDRSRGNRRVNWEARNSLTLTGPDTNNRGRQASHEYEGASDSFVENGDFYIAETGDEGRAMTDIGLDNLDELSADQILERAEQAAEEVTRGSESEWNARGEGTVRRNMGRLNPLSDDQLRLNEDSDSAANFHQAYTEPASPKRPTNAKNGFWAHADSQPMTLGAILQDDNNRDQCCEQQFCARMWACAPPPDECCLDSWKRDMWRTYNTCMVGKAGCGPLGLLWLPGEGVIPGIPRVIRAKGGLLSRFRRGGRSTTGDFGSEGCCENDYYTGGFADDSYYVEGDDFAGEIVDVDDGYQDGNCANGNCAANNYGGGSGHVGGASSSGGW